jgi:hypothetical protein
MNNVLANRLPDFLPSAEVHSSPQMCSMDSESRSDILHSSLVILPTEHPQRARIAALVQRLAKQPVDTIVDALEIEVQEMAIALGPVIEALREKASRESAQIIDEYRDTAIERMRQRLSDGFIVRSVLDELSREFECGHRRYPNLSAWVSFRAAPAVRGPGSLLFRELGNRAVSAGRSECSEPWMDWLEILVGFLLSNDLDEEYINPFASAGNVGTTPTIQGSHPGELHRGEHYRICHLFEASEYFCSWLRKARTSASIDIVSHQRQQRLDLCASQWEDIKIRFLSDQRVQVFIRGNAGASQNFADMGFEDRRGGGGKPKQAWHLLQALSNTNGVFPVGAISGKQGIQKRAMELRSLLSKHFRIAQDPIPFVDGIGYRSRFKIERSPACDT